MPFVLAALAIFLLPAAGLYARGHGAAAGACVVLALVATLYLAYFFRDPTREPPADDKTIVAGADGVVAAVTELREDAFLRADAYRVSIFLSLFNVHVNRAPITGTVRHLEYCPGKRYFTFLDKSSEYNQHSKIFIDGPHTRCLVNQIVGPVARRVVYWLRDGQELGVAERIGMMKFGSRLDMYFPKEDVTILVKPGDKVQAGLTVVARLIETSTA